MSLSRVVFSPFGWGEVCFRDYEAVALGAVLLKPSMEHVQTNPNVYQAYETYVPVKWDLSDLPQACDWCMQNPDRCRQITRNARRVLRDYLNGGFYADLKRMLEDAIRRRRLAAP
jgi:hypothetical protein